jgi:IS30 family transposase
MNKSATMYERKKVIIWDKWEKGISMGEIARAINKPPATIFSYLRYHGGIQPYKRSRSSLSLTLEDREEISRGIAAEQSIRSISRLLGRHASTISREIKKNGGLARYRASIADKKSWKRGKRPKQCLLACNAKLKSLVACKLAKNWSPEQISGWLKLTFPEDGSLHVSHETIYKSLFIQTRGLFRKEMRNHLRTKRKFRHAKGHKVGSRGKIIDGIFIIS